jgi:bacterioferritin
MNIESPLSGTKKLRAQARLNIEKGAITATYSADRVAILKLLNDALATEIVCVLRYRCHYFAARGIYSKGVAEEFLIHSNEELGHVDLLASRIVQLGGEPNFAPDELTQRSHAEFIVGASLEEMITEDLVAERIAIDSYREVLSFIGDQDPTTSHILKSILAVEEEHADELSDLLMDASSFDRIAVRRETNRS